MRRRFRPNSLAAIEWSRPRVEERIRRHPSSLRVTVAMERAALRLVRDIAKRRARAMLADPGQLEMIAPGLSASAPGAMVARLEALACRARSLRQSGDPVIGRSTPIISTPRFSSHAGFAAPNCGYRTGVRPRKGPGDLAKRRCCRRARRQLDLQPHRASEDGARHARRFAPRCGEAPRLRGLGLRRAWRAGGRGAARGRHAGAGRSLGPPVARRDAPLLVCRPADGSGVCEPPPSLLRRRCRRARGDRWRATRWARC